MRARLEDVAVRVAVRVLTGPPAFLVAGLLDLAAYRRFVRRQRAAQARASR